MEMMYVKYINGERYSIIKEGKNTMINNSKIVQFDSMVKSKTNKNEYNNCLKNKRTETYHKSDDRINEEITNFFFDAIHKNYLSNKNK